MWPFKDKFTKEINEVKLVLDGLPTKVRAYCEEFRDNEEDITKFCTAYNIPCAPTHYDNLFLDFDVSLGERLELLVKPLKNHMKKNKAAFISKVKEFKSHDEAIFLMIIRMCEGHLGSGSYHIYRGVLSPVGHTLALIHYALCCISENKGFLSEEERKNIVSYTNGAINEVG